MFLLELHLSGGSGGFHIDYVTGLVFRAKGGGSIPRTSDAAVFTHSLYDTHRHTC